MNQRYYFDLHTHSTDASDDAGATVEGYLKWLMGKRRKGYQVDGIVLTEHRCFDPSVDYGWLAASYGVQVLKGAELETEIGHVLVYGLTSSFAKEFDLSRVDLPSVDVFRAAWELGGYAIGAHAGRPRIGIWDHVERGVDVSHVPAIEVLNGGSNDLENERAMVLAERHGLKIIGGSDAHYVSAIGRCLTAFSSPIASMEDLVEQLRAGEYEPAPIEDTFRGVE